MLAIATNNVICDLSQVKVHFEIWQFGNANDVFKLLRRVLFLNCKASLTNLFHNSYNPPIFVVPTFKMIQISLLSIINCPLSFQSMKKNLYDDSVVTMTCFWKFYYGKDEGTFSFLFTLLLEVKLCLLYHLAIPMNYGTVHLLFNCELCWYSTVVQT